MEPMARALIEMFRNTHGSFELAVDDLDREQLVHRTRGGRGPSILWHIGHMMHYRVILLNRLGDPRESPYAAAFAGEGATDGADYPAIGTLREQWSALHADIEKAFEGLTDAALDSKYRLPDGKESARTLLGAFGFYAWHEATHVGGLTAIRVELGMPSVAERRFGAGPRK